MADPRAIFNLEGTGAEFKTFKYDSTIVYSATSANGSASVGLAVTLTAGQTVGLTADGNPVEGKLIMVESDGFCTVMTEGVTTLPGGASASLTAGQKIVGALGASSAKGYIRNAASATAAEANSVGGEILDATDTANVVVDLI